MMTKTIRRCVEVLALASIASVFGATTSLTAQEGPGRGYSQISGGAYAVVADVKAKVMRMEILAKSDDGGPIP
jgi:hypothetical protein